MFNSFKQFLRTWDISFGSILPPLPPLQLLPCPASFPNSWPLLYYFYTYIYNPLSPLHVAVTYMCLGLTTCDWSTCMEACLWRKFGLCFSAATDHLSLSSRNGTLWNSLIYDGLSPSGVSVSFKQPHCWELMVISLPCPGSYLAQASRSSALTRSLPPLLWCSLSLQGRGALQIYQPGLDTP